jgi:hypothetical protein
VRPHRVTDLARIGALGLLDGLDHDVRRRERARFLRQSAAEGLHELVVDLATAEFRQQPPHLGDVLFVSATLFGTLLKHGCAARRSAWPTWRWTARPRRSHAWSRRSRSTWTAWARPPWGTRRPFDWQRTRRWCREFGLELARTTPATTSTRAARATPFSTNLFAAMFAAWQSSAIALELAVALQLVSF